MYLLAHTEDQLQYLFLARNQTTLECRLLYFYNITQCSECVYNPAQKQIIYHFENGKMCVQPNTNSCSAEAMAITRQYNALIRTIKFT